MNTYPFRTTTKVNETTYCEDRGYPHHIDINDSNFNILNNEFGTLLNVGQTAIRRNDSWEVLDTFPLLNEAKNKKLIRLKEYWSRLDSNDTIMSKVGFEINANKRAQLDLRGLLDTMSDSDIVLFCDANNDFHRVTRKQVSDMLTEIILHSQSIYDRKWQLRNAIVNAKSFEELNKIEITFK